MKGKKPPRLLVCDPDPQERSMIRKYLEGSPIEVSFTTQKEAVKDILTTRSPFNAVVIDLPQAASPACKGLISSVKKVSPGTEIIFLSRLADESLWSQVLSSGAYDLLPKPPERSEFLRAVFGAVQGEHAA